MNDLVTQQVLDTFLAISDTEARAEQVAAAIDMLGTLKRRIAEVKAQAEADILAWIKANQPITVGDVRYYAGVEKVTRCVDGKATLVALLDAAGGDMDAVAGCLASGAWKHGAARQILGDATPLFVTEEKDDLKTGKPKEKLLTADLKWMR